MKALNASGVARLFADNIGKRLKATEIRTAFDKAFGKGTGKRIRIKCKRDGARLLIQEITIGLYGEFDAATTLSQLMLSAKPTNGGCEGGIVDAVGLQ